MVKFGKVLRIVLPVRMVQMIYHVNSIFFLAEISTYGTIVLLCARHVTVSRALIPLFFFRHRIFPILLISLTLAKENSAYMLSTMVVVR
jgi:hypothetical protein